MKERVTLGGLGSTATTVGIVVYEVVGGITHLKGLSSSPLKEDSGELLFAFIPPLQRKL
jgi:hypothetical protein